MTRIERESTALSRRRFLQRMGWAPLVFVPAPLSTASRLFRSATPEPSPLALALPDERFAPLYPSKSPLEDVLAKVPAGADEFVTEKYACEIIELLERWSGALKMALPAGDALQKLLDSSLRASSLIPAETKPLRQSSEFEVWRRRFDATAVLDKGRFLAAIRAYFGDLARIETAELQVTALDVVSDQPRSVKAEIRYDLVGTQKNGAREQRIGRWLTEWVHGEAEGWKAIKWTANSETLSRARAPLFLDITAMALGKTRSYGEQLVYGVDHWRGVLDGACGIDIYGNNGVAVGDFDSDGSDDFYVCQPPGLPNRLYRNRGDGTFEDVTEQSGVGLLDATAAALFADFENKGVQDLLVVCSSGPLLFLNQGNGKFVLKRDAFQFEHPPQGSFTHAAAADYDGDGRLDLYFCVYSYYLGLDQYHYPSPYFDARNGPPNFLFHNEGNGTFRDRTAAAGLSADNDRFSFACAWGDYSGSGRQDLYVANDFGRSNLYRNNGDATFSTVSAGAGVEDPGAGMSAAWLDFDADGQQDIYVGNMWSAAGLRVSQQKNFHANDPEQVRALYRRHASGNSLYRNRGGGRFQNVSTQADVEMGRWAWCSDSWDFDHDGYPDLYIANGYISSPERLDSVTKTDDLSSFFWRQVVGNSPSNNSPSPNYEHGWNAVNELIRSDYSWNGYERNVLYVNNHDGTFTDISGIAGMDLVEDGRSFALVDIDHDGRLEVILKNRNAPQVRILRNAMKDLRRSIAFRLLGTKSNRDAIGAAITIHTGSHSQTKYVQAGSGFLAQHTKELFFGLGENAEAVHATIRWPSGLSQSFLNLPVDHRLEVREGADKFEARPFAASAAGIRSEQPSDRAKTPSSSATWLMEPLHAPDFSLADVSGKLVNLRALQGRFVLLCFWATATPVSIEQLNVLQRHQSALLADELQCVAINLDDASRVPAPKLSTAQQNFSFPLLRATAEIAGIYNIIYRYLFDRRRDLAVPTSLLVDKQGQIVKLYQGPCEPEQVIQDLKNIPATPEERLRRALPFPGVLCQDRFERNEFTYGVALFQHGYLEHAATSFQQVIASDPGNAEAHYNLGTLYLRTNRLPEAREYLQKAVGLLPSYPEAWNNLGMLAAQQQQDAEAIKDFEHALELRPTYTVALLNLGNLYRRRNDFQRSEELLTRAQGISPDDPDINYNLGMLYARQDHLDKATPYLERAIQLRPDYPDALNNLGVLFVRGGRNTEAEEEFQACIRIAPAFDQAYLNLARLYVVLDEKDKARDILQALLKVQPGHAVAQKALELLN